MPDETKPGQEAQGGQEAQNKNAAQSSEGRDEDLPAWAQKKLRDYREEAKGHREAKEKQERESTQREQARLAEEGKWKELAEARERDLAKYQPYEQRATALEKIINDSNAKRIAQIPEQLRPLVPQLPPEQLASYLDTNWALLMRKPAPDTDAGAGMGGSPVSALTPEELAMAKRMNLTPEKFAAAKQKT